MLPRPKPGESEEDLLRFQSQFLAAGTSAAVQIVKKADKRKGDIEKRRDVVTLGDFPDVPPVLTPAPPKKSKFKNDHVCFTDDDPEEVLERHDRHITAVFSKIIERDTSSAAVTVPLPTGDPFPRVFHRSEIRSEEKTKCGRSIFAQLVAAKRATWDAVISQPAVGTSQQTAGVVPDNSCALTLAQDVPFKSNGQDDSKEIADSYGPCLITGEGLRGSEGEMEAQRIHEENLEKLRSMSQEKILYEQEKLLTQLEPSLVSFLKSQRSKGGIKEMCKQSQTALMRTEPQNVWAEPSKEVLDMDGSGKGEQQLEEKTMEFTEDDLPVKLQRDWIHMDTVEFEKLEWMKDLPQSRQGRMRKGMQARFSLKGDLIPPDADLPTHLGLHHHGEEAERAGYSLQELFHLSRSQVIQQRALALHVLARIIQKAKQGEFSSTLKGSVLRLLLDAGFLFLLRFSLDDSMENVIAASVHAFHALLVSSEDEEYLDKAFSWYQGSIVFPFLPNKEDDEEEDEEEEKQQQPESNATEEERRKKSKEENKPDTDVARYDVIKGLLKTKILHRLRYILEVVRPVPVVVLDTLDILTRVARHSLEACHQILDCPRLLDTVIREFLPTQWSLPAVGDREMLISLHGVPCAAAMKLLRVLVSAGRSVSARLLNKFDLKSYLSRFVVQEPQDLPLQHEEAVRLSTEAFRLWSLAAGYAQACDLYSDLYPVLVQILQSFPGLTNKCFKDSSLSQLYIQWAAAVVTLLTSVTLTAGCTAELHKHVSSGLVEKPQYPPPPVTWIQVSGLKPNLEALLKRSLQTISCSDTWQALQPLTTAYIIYLGAYYSACSRQPSVNIVQSIEEVEQLTSEVLLPFLQQPAMRHMWELLRPCSAVCNPHSCSPASESIASIVSLSCTRGKLPLSLVGLKSPFPFLTALLFLINNIVNIHKGLVSKFSCVLESRELNDYLLKSWTAESPHLTHSSAWILRHEYHLQYFALLLTRKVVVTCPEHSQHASVYHCVAMALLSRLLPGGEHLAHELLEGFIFNHELIPEGKSGGPEAADFSDILHIRADGRPMHPGSVVLSSPNPSRGTLLEEAYRHLPSIRACYLLHLAHLEMALARSKAVYEGQTYLVQSMLLPETKGPILPSDWPFLPLIVLYNKVANAETRGAVLNTLPPDLVNIVTRNLQWILLLETWRAKVLEHIPSAAKLSRLFCIFLTGGDLFLEGPVHCYTAALLSLYCQAKSLDSLQLDAPLPGLASFYDLYIDLLEQFEGVSFGDHLFGIFVLLPLQRRFSVQLRLAVFGEHVSALRVLGVPFKEFPIPLERYTSPPEDSLPLLKLYFRTLVTKALRPSWCPILYAVAVAHMNSFIFSQDNVAQEVDLARKSMLRKTWLLTDEVLKKHLIFYKLPNTDNLLGFDVYEQLPPLRQRYLDLVTEQQPSKLKAST
ncbi:RNA polymerase II-associated protein 1 isoform X2 [Microcaecilia unicolor]|uniref:RNA polymerase II-associated protein 1 isoform X2 n=1 Tax=Microcaecilia unicolor TaxID=1415580 RepID=A0A6P7YYF4_9AMPH|nr:RNA polymerase II-associated protein 1 isoform X2 [Microcaecilia unicolor]